MMDVWSGYGEFDIDRKESRDERLMGEVFVRWLAGYLL